MGKGVHGAWKASLSALLQPCHGQSLSGPADQRASGLRVSLPELAPGPGSWSFVFPGSVPASGSVERVGVVAATSLGGSLDRVPSDHHLHLCTQGTWPQPRVGGRWPTFWWRPANLGLAIPSLSFGSSFVNGAGLTRSVTRGHGAHQSLGSSQTDCSCSGNGTHHHVIICMWAWQLSKEPVVSWPDQPVPFTPHSSAGTVCLGGTHTAPSYLPRQACCPMHLPLGATSLTGEGVCLPHPNFPDTSCRLQVLGACSADTDRIWASLSIHFLLTSTLKSLKLKTRAVRPRAGNGMTTDPEVRQVQP